MRPPGPRAPERGGAPSPPVGSTPPGALGDRLADSEEPPPPRGGREQLFPAPASGRLRVRASLRIIPDLAEHPSEIFGAPAPRDPRMPVADDLRQGPRVTDGNGHPFCHRLGRHQAKRLVPERWNRHNGGSGKDLMRIDPAQGLADVRNSGERALDLAPQGSRHESAVAAEQQLDAAWCFRAERLDGASQNGHALDRRQAPKEADA